MFGDQTTKTIYLNGEIKHDHPLHENLDTNKNNIRLLRKNKM